MPNTYRLSRTLVTLAVCLVFGSMVGCTSFRGEDQNRKLQLLSDRIEVAALANQYAWGVDTLDRALLAQTFAKDASAHYLAVGSNPMNLDAQLSSFDEIFGWLDRHLGHRKPTESLPVHFVSNRIVTLDGDAATLRFYMHNRAMSVGGVYTVGAIRTRAGWRIGSLLLEEQTWDASAYEGDTHAQEFFDSE